jgi:hypothetical protein
MKIKATEKNRHDPISWLLEGDAAIRYQTHRDLLVAEESELEGFRKLIALEGWGARYLSARNKDGSWGRGFYMPKWISTHYTLLDLMNLGLHPANTAARESIERIFSDTASRPRRESDDRSLPSPDVCVNGMVLAYASYFGAHKSHLEMLVDYLLDLQMRDGGWNCMYNRGATHSSLHTTLSVLEGLHEYLKTGGALRRSEILSASERGEEFILSHRLYQSHNTGEIIDRRMLMLSFPSRWRYDILRCLDYFRAKGLEFDTRMGPAIGILLSKRRKDGTWPLQAKHPGQVHFDMEEPGQPSRWNTLRALRVLEWFGKISYGRL